MPNAIKYNVSTETLALKKGNFWIGTGSVGKGPTSSTGYYNGITPPTGGYTIYLNKVSGGPSIYVASNDDQLVGLTNSIASASYTTAQQCFDYYAEQSDKFLTTQDYPTTFPYIVLDGLVVYFDANINQSYPGSGGVWYDISGVGPKSSLNMNGNNPTFSTVNNVKCFKTDDSRGQGFGSNINGKMPSTDATLESWVYANPTNLTSADRGCIILLAGSSVYQSWNLDNNNLSNYWYNHSPEGYFEPNIALTRQVWVNLTSVWEYSTSTLKQYINGSLVATHTTQGNSSTGNYLQIGYEGCCGDRNFPGYISVIRIYNKPLSAADVLQNYNAQKSTFGL